MAWFCVHFLAPEKAEKSTDDPSFRFPENALMAVYGGMIMKTKLTRIVALVLIIVSVLSLSVPAFAQTNIPKNSTAYVSQSEARVRAKPDKNSTLVKTLKKNATVKILATTSTYHGWYKVSFTAGGTSYTGYIREDYLKKSSQQQEPTLTNWEIEYGTSTYRIGNSSSFIQNIKQDLKTWAMNTWYNNTYPQKTVYEAMGCFRTMNTGSKYFDDATRLAVRYFQERKGLDIDGVVGKQTKKALYNATH